jgi:hypothetical protein
MIVRPTLVFAERPEVLAQRTKEKGWLKRWPRLTALK